MPWDFWRLTPAEFKLQLEAHSGREEKEWRRTAWQAANIMNVWLDKNDRVTVDDLLPKKQKQREPQTVEEQIAIAEAWVAALGGIDKRKGVH